jgi:hypothetical protein
MPSQWCRIDRTHALLLLLSVYGKDACIVPLLRFLVDIPFRSGVTERAGGIAARTG